MKRKLYIASILAGAIAIGCASKKNKNATPSSTGMSSSESMAHQFPVEGVPPYANEEKSGNGPLEYKATEDGRVFLADTTDNVVLFSGKLAKDQTFALDPEARRATIDGKYVFTREIYPSHSHKLYFTAE
jgi:hypothetical protein